MPSSYSSNLKIELQATGENSGTWGNITNTNLGTALEQAIVGYGNPSYASDANLTLTYTDTNAAQAARALVLNVTSAVSLTGTRELVVPTIQKQYIVQNNTTGSQSITVKTSAGTGITVPNGRKAHLYVDGTNVIFMDDFVDINGGAIDGTTIGANSAAAGTFTTVGATTGNITTLNATTVDTTNIEVTNLKAKDGTAAGSIADATGVVTLGSSVLTTTDINGGTIDGTTIGGSSAAAGTFTTLTTSSTVTLNGGTANGVLYLNGSKVATSGSALTFDGTNLGIGTSSPAQKLHVLTSASGDVAQFITSAGGGQGMKVGIDTTNSLMYFKSNTSAYSYSWQTTTGTSLMLLTDSGNLGIGTSSPDAQGGNQSTILNLEGSDNLVYFSGGSGGNAIDDGLAIEGVATGVSSGDKRTGSILMTRANTSTTSLDSKIAFYTTSSGTHAERMRLDSSGNLGIGTSSPAYKLHVSNYMGLGTQASSGAGAGINMIPSSTLTNWFVGANYVNSGAFEIIPSTAGGGSTFSTPAFVLNSSGNLGLGVTPSAWDSGYKALQIGQAASFWGATGSNFTTITNNAIFDGDYKYKNNGIATQYTMGTGGTHAWSIAASGTAGGTISFTQALTLDASGNLGVGTTSPQAVLHIQGAANEIMRLQSSDATTGSIWFSYYDSTGNRKGYCGFGSASSDQFQIWNEENDAMVFATNNTERARITSDGLLLVGKTADNDSAGITLRGNGSGYFVKSTGAVLGVNRLDDDGELVQFFQASIQEGSISVSGNTVSYNAFAGSHWSQLQDGSRPDILRGTVMESINELCVWPGEQNERLPKSKVSDTAGSKKVYGVFMAWDNDWTTTNDMYVTAVGAFICRVNGSVTVQEGDLLESNGDGTARVQADDIIRSSTIGKVTSTVKTHQYDDGSYCVPTVLYCG